MTDQMHYTTTSKEELLVTWSLIRQNGRAHVSLTQPYSIYSLKNSKDMTIDQPKQVSLLQNKQTAATADTWIYHMNEPKWTLQDSIS